MYNFDYHKPASVADAVALLSKADDGKLMAGGMTLLPTLKQRLAQPSDVIDLGALDDLRGIRREGDSLIIGAMTTHGAVAHSKEVKAAIPALASLAEMIGDPQVRNRGTLGGSICNNDPAADYPAALVGLGATVTTNQRTIAAEAFFTGMFETALAEDEIVQSVTFPLVEKAAYEKFRNPASRYAIVGAFVARTAAGARVAITGAGACVFRWKEAEAALDKSFAPSSVEGLKASASGLNSDIHASAEYRAHLVGVMTKRAVAAAG